MLEYLQKLIEFRPVTNDQQAVRRLLEYVAEHFTKRGYKAKIHVFNGIHNLYISPTGSTHSKILLQGHVDVVPGGQPFSMDNEACYGCGTYDMLFAVAAYMKLADTLHTQKQTYDIAILLTGDEEIGGQNGVEAMLENGITTDVCILPDAGDDWGSLSVAAKGIYWPIISIRGQAHHGSRPWEGDGAAIKLAHFLVEVEELFDTSDPFNSTLTVAQITAGKAQNQGPTEAEVSLDIRYKDQTDLARIIQGTKQLLKKYNGEVISEISGSDYRLDPDVPLIKHFIDVYEKHVGRPIRQTKAHGSSDARFFTEHNISVIMLRPDGGNAHGDKEWLSLVHYQKFYDLLEEYIKSAVTKV